MKKRNLYYIDIMRAVCCLAVFVEHFTASFKISALYRFRAFTGITPFTYFNDGRLAINMFCTISGFLMFYHSYDDYCQNIDNEKVTYSLIKRLIYMYLPCVFVCIFSYFIMRHGLFFNHLAYNKGADEYIIGVYNFTPTFRGLIDCIKGIFTGNTPLSPQLWTMKYEIWGGVACFFIILVSTNKNILRWGLYLFFLYVARYIVVDNYFECFFCGMIAAELCRKHRVCRNKVMGYIGVVISLTLASASYYMGGEFHFLIPIFSACFLWFGYGLWNEVSKVIFPLEMVRILGECSYGFYLVHFTVIVSFSAFLYTMLIDILSFNWTFVICFFLTFWFCALISYIIHNYFMDKLNKIIKKMYCHLN